MWSERGWDCRCVLCIVCVCVRVTGVTGHGCLPRCDCWPHTQALPRQRRVVNNRRAMTEGRHTQTEISIKVKDGCGRNRRALYRRVINTWGGSATLGEGAGEQGDMQTTWARWHLHVKYCRGLYVLMTVQSISSQQSHMTSLPLTHITEPCKLMVWPLMRSGVVMIIVFIMWFFRWVCYGNEQINIWRK